MNDKPLYIIFDRTEGVADSILKDLTTFMVVGLLVYISRGSTWWTLVTGLMFIIFASARIAAILKDRQTIFRTKDELRKWVEKLPEDEKQS